MMARRGRTTEATLARGGFRKVCSNKPKVKNITAHKTGQMITDRGKSGTIRIYTTRSNWLEGSRAWGKAKKGSYEASKVQSDKN